MTYNPDAEWVSGWGIGDSCSNLFRIKVPNGWIVERSYIQNNITTTSICFVPDSKHEWILPEQNEQLKEVRDYYNAL